MQKWIIKASGLFLFLLFLNLALAATPITPSEVPSTTDPGVLGKQMTEQLPQQPSSGVSQVTQPKQTSAQQAEIEQAKRIKFKLIKIVLEGNHVYSDKELSAIYQDKLNTTITVAELMVIVQSITNYYRNHGYILSQAILPPQHIASGVVHVRILEGFINQINVIGDSLGAKSILEDYGNKILQSKPLKVEVLDYYLRVMNNIPGVTARAVLEPSKTTVAASTLNIVTDIKTLSGYFSYDNYGSLYNGPLEDTVSATANSIFLSGDTTRATYLATTRPKELLYRDLSYGIPVGSSGLRFTADANQSNTRSGLNLRQLKIYGISNTYSGQLQYPLILSAVTNLNLNAGFNYIDSGVNTLFSETLYKDYIRSVQVGVDFNHADTFDGTNSANATLEEGLIILGATNDPQSLTISHFGATGKYTKLNLQFSRTQQLGTRFSVVILGKGQYSCQPLLSTEQFSFGGSQLGRGYDSADIIGDLGAAGSLELRMNVTPGWALLQFIQPYIFYDGGVIWNRNKIGITKTKQSETSAGGGFRIVFTQHLSGNFMIGQPLTKKDTTEAIRGDGRRPRGLFSVTMSV